MKKTVLCFSFILLFIAGCSDQHQLKINDTGQIDQFTIESVVTANQTAVIPALQMDIADARYSTGFLFLKTNITELEQKIYDQLYHKQDLSCPTLENQSLTYQITAHYAADQEQTLAYRLQIDHPNNTGLLTRSVTDSKGETQQAGILIEKIEDTTLYDAYLIPQIGYSIDDYLPTLQLTAQSASATSLFPSIAGNWNYHIFQDIYKPQSIRIPNLSPQPIRLTQSEEKLVLQLKTDFPPPTAATAKLYTNQSKTELLEQYDLDIAQNITLPSPSGNGSCYLVAELSYVRQAEKDYGAITYELAVEKEFAESYTLNQVDYQPGDLIVIKGSQIDSDLNYEITTDLYHQGLGFTQINNGYYLLLPLTCKTEPKTYHLTITDPDSKQPPVKLAIPVVAKKFPEQQLTVSPSVASKRNQENYDQLNEAFKRGRQTSADTPLWDGPFLQPVGGRISTEYGTIRYTNGSTESSRHAAIDFANPTGTPIKATQNGIVTLAEDIAITGNTIFIDHGLGFFSQYYHLDDMTVQVGDTIKKGDLIGHVGTTGFSSGPHLHFAIYKNGIYLNPWKFFDHAPF